MFSIYGVFLQMTGIHFILHIFYPYVGRRIKQLDTVLESFIHIKTKELNRNRLISDLKNALKQDELTLYYQPILNSKKQIIGMEALLRWEHSIHGFISPETIVKVAEQVGIIDELGEWVLKTACKQAKRWHKSGQAISIAVNVSPTQFKDSLFVDKVRDVLTETSLEPELLELEITEHVNSLGIKGIHSTLRRLKALGVTLSLDDFGTGYASLQTINQLSVDGIKIDKQFVMNIHSSDPKSHVIAQNIISLAENLNIEIVAEGIESYYQYKLLSSGYCDRFQGYYFYKPLSSKESERIIRQQVVEQ